MLWVGVDFFWGVEVVIFYFGMFLAAGGLLLGGGHFLEL